MPRRTEGIKIRRIVVPVDFSPRCETAARHARLIAQQFESELSYLHVVDGSLVEVRGSRVAGSEADEFYKFRLRNFVEKIGDETASRVVLRGEPAERIAHYCHEQGADLVVIPTHGYGRFRKLLLGSLSAKILHDLKCPVFTGAHLEENPPPPESYRRIACAVDSSEPKPDLLRWAWEFSQMWRAQFTAVLALPSTSYGQELSAAVRAENEREMRDAAVARVSGTMDRLGCPGTVEVGFGGVVSTVSKIAETIEADLLVVGRGEAKGRSSRLPTHTYGLVRESPCPVISV